MLLDLAITFSLIVCFFLRRMNDVLNKRIYEVNTDVVKETICGTFNGIRSGKKLVGVAIGIFCR